MTSTPLGGKVHGPGLMGNNRGRVLQRHVYIGEQEARLALEEGQRGRKKQHIMQKERKRKEWLAIIMSTTLLIVQRFTIDDLNSRRKKITGGVPPVAGRAGAHRLRLLRNTKNEKRITDC